MTAPQAFDEAGLDLDDSFEESELEEDDAFAELDELEGLDDELDTDELDAADEFSELDELDDDLLDEDVSDEFASDLDGFADDMEDVGGVAQGMNYFVLDALDADDAEAFLRRVRRGLRRVARGVGRVGRVVGRVGGPLLRRALPIVQRVAGVAGPWGRLVSAGIGAARGLMKGRGLRGALAGAVSGAIPGVGGRLAARVLGGDGADDDAALDALADMADAGQVPAAVAMPLGAGLATRITTPRGTGAWSPGMRRSARQAEITMLRAARAAGGPAGRRIRILRAIARLARAGLRRASSTEAAAQALPSVVQGAARRVIRAARQRPSAGISSRPAALRRLSQRRQVLSRLPARAMFPQTARTA